MGPENNCNTQGILVKFFFQWCYCLKQLYCHILCLITFPLMYRSPKCSRYWLRKAWFLILEMKEFDQKIFLLDFWKDCCLKWIYMPIICENTFPKRSRSSRLTNYWWSYPGFLDPPPLDGHEVPKLSSLTDSWKVDLFSLCLLWCLLHFEQNYCKYTPAT